MNANFKIPSENLPLTELNLDEPTVRNCRSILVYSVQSSCTIDYTETKIFECFKKGLTEAQFRNTYEFPKRLSHYYKNFS